jgi:hypothetical protein
MEPADICFVIAGIGLCVSVILLHIRMKRMEDKFKELNGVKHIV